VYTVIYTKNVLMYLFRTYFGGPIFHEAFILEFQEDKMKKEP